jgi:2-haloacid dehalogenase
VRAADVRLVAAHAWDVSGALAAGCAAAFVRRAGKVPSPLGDQPDIIGTGLDDVADRIIEIEGRKARVTRGVRA